MEPRIDWSKYASPKLRELAFKPLDAAQTESFGDWMELWQRGPIQLRVVSDRSQIAVELRRVDSAD